MDWGCASVPKAKKPLALASYEDIFKTGEAAMAAAGQVWEAPLADLHLPEHYPFQLRGDAAMWENVENIKEGTAIAPCIVRSRQAGGYEIITGQRTMRACELAERGTAPVVTSEMDDDAATILMVNANLPQEKILPSKRHGPKALIVHHAVSIQGFSLVRQLKTCGGALSNVARLYAILTVQYAKVLGRDLCIIGL